PWHFQTDVFQRPEIAVVLAAPSPQNLFQLGRRGVVQAISLRNVLDENHCLLPSLIAPAQADVIFVRPQISVPHTHWCNSRVQSRRDCQVDLSLTRPSSSAPWADVHRPASEAADLNSHLFPSGTFR